MPWGNVPVSPAAAAVEEWRGQGMTGYWDAAEDNNENSIENIAILQSNEPHADKMSDTKPTVVNQADGVTIFRTSAHLTSWPLRWGTRGEDSDAAYHGVACITRPDASTTQTMSICSRWYEHAWEPRGCRPCIRWCKPRIRWCRPHREYCWPLINWRSSCRRWCRLRIRPYCLYCSYVGHVFSDDGHV